MKLQLVTKNTAYNGPTPLIATLKDSIATGVLEMNEHARRGFKMSYTRVRDEVNKKVDEYIKLRTLKSV